MRGGMLHAGGNISSGSHSGRMQEEGEEMMIGLVFISLAVDSLAAKLHPQVNISDLTSSHDARLPQMSSSRSWWLQDGDARYYLYIHPTEHCTHNIHLPRSARHDLLMFALTLTLGFSAVKSIERYFQRIYNRLKVAVAAIKGTLNKMFWYLLHAWPGRLKDHRVIVNSQDSVLTFPAVTEERKYLARLS